MPRFVVLNGQNEIITAIIADTKEDAETLTDKTCIEVANAPGAPGLGWIWDGANFIQPEPTE